jgi:hypothetical protein
VTGYALTFEDELLGDPLEEVVFEAPLVGLGVELAFKPRAALARRLATASYCRLL